MPDAKFYDVVLAIGLLPQLYTDHYRIIASYVVTLHTFSILRPGGNIVSNMKDGWNIQKGRFTLSSVFFMPTRLCNYCQSRRLTFWIMIMLRFCFQHHIFWRMARRRYTTYHTLDGYSFLIVSKSEYQKRIFTVWYLIWMKCK